MDALAAAIAAKRQNTQAEFKGRKYVKRSELEEARLRKLREDELAEQVKRGAATQDAQKGPAEKRQKRDSKTVAEGAAAEAEEASITVQEVFRRLRALGQPITHFGEDDAARRARLKAAAASFELADEQKGLGQQNNEMLALQRAEKEKLKAEKLRAESLRTGKKDKQQADHQEGPEQAQPEASTSGRDATEPDSEDAKIMAAFQAAAEAVKAKQAEANMCTEDRIVKNLRSWCKAWEDDMDRRATDIKESGPGIQATMMYKQTMGFFKPLFRDLQKRLVDGEMLAGLWMIVDAIQQRNYLYAYDIYMRLAIGNAPWPIGVTSVGIHERSSREKISHVTGMNVAGSAHVMNDEATRKWLQAIKRLLSFMQRAFPTDPSRSVDFDGFRSAARGAAGGGSDKLALLAAESSGATWKEEGLKPAPHFLAEDGSVRVPQSWHDMVKSTMRTLESHPSDSPGRGSPALLGRNSPALASPTRSGTPPLKSGQTPPRSPVVSKPVAAAQVAEKRQRAGSPLRTS